MYAWRTRRSPVNGAGSRRPVAESVGVEPCLVRPEVRSQSIPSVREAAVARTPGAKNRTPRELRAEAKRLTEKASYKEKLEKLKKEAQKKK